MDTKTLIIELVSAATKLPNHNIAEIIEVPKVAEMGDFALPCFKLAATMKKDPQQIAKDIAAHVKLPKDLIKEVKVSGPYVNFFVNKSSLAEAVLTEVFKKKGLFGSADIGKGKQVVLDVIGLNPNKEGHIGHVRNGCIGDSLARVYKFAGFRISTQSFINDQGLPTAMTFYASKKLRGKLPKKLGHLKKEDHWQGAIYTFMEKLLEKDARVKKEVEAMQYVLEHHKDMKLVNEQRAFIEACKAAQSETWNRLGADFDLGVHESDITTSGVLAKTVELLKKKGAVYVSKEDETRGCLMLKLSHFDAFKGMKNADKIIVRADGRTTYTGKDVGMQFWRFGLVPDLMKYSVSSKTPGHTEWATNNLSGKNV
ncbi:MAG: arginine--tRNA ligase, partial [archaeon]